MSISIVAAIDENYGLGKNNQLLCHLPADLKHFKELTMGKPIIMGRKTFQSIGKPLPERLNIVLTKEATSIEGVAVARSFSEALDLAKPAAEVMVIGGEAVFKEALLFAEDIYLTVIHHQFEPDVYFPILSPATWQCITKVFRPLDEKNSYDMTFYHYKRGERRLNKHHSLISSSGE